MALRIRALAGIISWAFLAGVAGLLVLSAWAMAPFSSAPADVLQAADRLARAPFASRVVIGDSRVQFATQPPDALFAGFGGATSRDLDRFAALMCTFSRAQVTIALGINDTKPAEVNVGASRRAFTRIAQSCEREGLWIAGIWPAEAGVEPAGDDYDPLAIASLDAFLEELAAEVGARRIDVPTLRPGFTYDGVHFTQPVSQDYADRLAFPDGR